MTEPMTEPGAARVRSEADAVADAFCTAVAIVRRHYSELGHGRAPPLGTLERVGQALASSSANPMVPAVVTLAGAARDDAARAVQSAMLLCAMARRVTRDPRTLRRLAVAALLVDAGRARLGGLGSVDLDVFRQLPDQLDALVPASSAAVGMTSASSPTVEAAAATAFEVAWLERPRLGELYAGLEQPRFSARALRVVRAFLERTAPREGDRPSSPFAALSALGAEPALDRAALALLAATVGLLPVGTTVELDTGQWALVARPAPAGSAPDRPTVKLLTDALGRTHGPPATLDLGAPDATARIVRVLSPEETRFNAAQAFFGDFQGE